MKVEESKWIVKKILKYAKPNQKLLNIGSSTLEFRSKKTQSHISKNIFVPIDKYGIKVVHTDIQSDEGVDLVGNLLDKDFIKLLEKEKFDFILCSNLLEHLEEINPVCIVIEQVLKKNGYAIITVPYNYPYHLDPIDNMFRPTVSQLSKKFNNLEIINGEILNASSYNSKLERFEKNYFQKLLNNPRMLVLIFLEFSYLFISSMFGKKLCLE